STSDPPLPVPGEGWGEGLLRPPLPVPGEGRGEGLLRLSASASPLLPSLSRFRERAGVRAPSPSQLTPQRSPLPRSDTPASPAPAPRSACSPATHPPSPPTEPPRTPPAAP